MNSKNKPFSSTTEFLSWCYLERFGIQVCLLPQSGCFFNAHFFLNSASGKLASPAPSHSRLVSFSRCRSQLCWWYSQNLGVQLAQSLEQRILVRCQGWFYTNINGWSYDNSFFRYELILLMYALWVLEYSQLFDICQAPARITFTLNS